MTSSGSPAIPCGRHACTASRCWPTRENFVADSATSWNASSCCASSGRAGRSGGGAHSGPAICSPMPCGRVSSNTSHAIPQEPLDDVRHRDRRRARGAAPVSSSAILCPADGGLARSRDSREHGHLQRGSRGAVPCIPYSAPSELVSIWSDNTRLAERANPVSPANYEAFRTSSSLAGVEAMYSLMTSVQLRVDGDAEVAQAATITPGMFALLGRTALVGETFGAGESAPRVVLSYQYWRRRFNGDRNVAGRAVSLGATTAATIAGVMPEDFVFPYRSMLGPSGFTRALQADVWIPLTPATRVSLPRRERAAGSDPSLPWPSPPGSNAARRSTRRAPSWPRSPPIAPADSRTPIRDGA